MNLEAVEKRTLQIRFLENDANLIYMTHRLSILHNAYL